jgi:hypothetical protein
MPAVPALRRLRQEDHKFKASLGYIARLYLKKTKAKALEMLIVLDLNLGPEVYLAAKEFLFCLFDTKDVKF